MKPIIVMGILLALAAPLGAETYSWQDDGGNYHFTDDLSRAPKKYRDKINLRGDMSSGQPQTSTVVGSERTGTAETVKADVPGDKAAPGSSDSRQLYAGKTEAVWRSELAAQEQELHRLEGVLEQLQKQVTTPAGLSRDRLSELSKEYNETRASYNQKYAAYGELLDSARKAGFSVEMKK